MSIIDVPRPCSDLQKAGFDSQRAAEETWEAMLSADVFQEGEFEFASGLRATLKADAEKLYSHPRQLAVVMGHFAAFPCVKQADVLLYVPDGMRRFVMMLGQDLKKPVAHTMRKPGSSSKYEFVFATPDDTALAVNAERPVIGEDIVTTLGSVAGVRTLLKPEQDVHSLAFLLRDTVTPEYREGLADHYLLERQIPTDKYEFRRRLRLDDW